MGTGLAVVYGIGLWKEMQQWREEMRPPKSYEILMNNCKAETLKVHTVYEKGINNLNITVDNSDIMVNCQTVRDTCEICGREIPNFRGYKYYGHVLCDSCFYNFQEYLYQLWRKQGLKRKRTK